MPYIEFLFKSDFKCKVSPLSEAITKSMDEFLKVLSSSPNIEQINAESAVPYNMVTSLMVACERNQLGMVDILLNCLAVTVPNCQPPSSYRKFIYRKACPELNNISALHIAAMREPGMLQGLFAKSIESQKVKKEFSPLTNPKLLCKHNLYHIAAISGHFKHIASIFAHCGFDGLDSDSRVWDDMDLIQGTPVDLARDKHNGQCLTRLNVLGQLATFENFQSTFQQAKDLGLIDDRRLATYHLFKALEKSKTVHNKHDIAVFLLKDYLENMCENSYAIPDSWLKLCGGGLDPKTEAEFFEKNPSLIKSYLRGLDVSDAWLAQHGARYAQNQTMISALIGRLGQTPPVSASHQALHQFFRYVDTERLEGSLKTLVCMFYADALNQNKLPADELPGLLSDANIPNALIPSALAREAGKPWVVYKVRIGEEKIEPITFLYNQLEALILENQSEESSMLNKACRRNSL